MNKRELDILRILDDAVKQKSVTAQIEAILGRVEEKLTRTPEARLAWEPVPLTVYGTKLPEFIGSSWVFVIKAGARTGAERHPNSHQRMISFRGSGDLRVWDGEKWSSNLLISDANAQLEKRCVSIPPGTWHQAVVPQNNWVVVSFHTVPTDKLVEERPDPKEPRLTHQRRYVEK